MEFIFNSLFYITLILACSFKNIYAEVFTAVADLEELLQTEGILINVLENYVEAKEQQLDLLKRYLAIYQKQHHNAVNDVQSYVANPLNAYTLVKRLTADWEEVEALMSTHLAEDYLTNITNIKKSMKFPTDEDLNGAAVALTRLQDTYLLDTSSLARGELNGIKYSSELTAADCFELGRQSYRNNDYYHTVLWMKEADIRLKNEINQTINRGDILEYLAFSTYKLGNVQSALHITNELLEIFPAHPRAVGNKVYYEDELAKSLTSNKLKGDDESELIENSEISITSEDRHKRSCYESLCRGDTTITPEKESLLKCRYFNKNHPFLLLAPFKVEEAHLKPDIFIFHDVISDKEIEVIKTLAKPKFRRATVQNSHTGDLEVAHYRISKSAWLKENEHQYVADITQRITDMTGLTMSTAEELQVANYGIGGHYSAHYDFALRDEVKSFERLGTGNRIATVLFYMSNVEQGGATVFPMLGLSLWPKKGAAAFWFNLHPSGDGDITTLHAACPVLAGSKWVSNKWIHERGQEFLRPCTKERPDKSTIE